MRWIIRLWIFAVVAGLEAGGLLPAVMLLMPLLTEWLLAYPRDRVTPVLISVVGCYGSWTGTPPWLRAACTVWCALPALMAWLPVANDAGRRGAIWCGLTAAMSIVLLLLLGSRYDGQGIQGLADACAAWISKQPNAKDWLYQLAVSGVLKLKASQAELATMRVFGAWGMSIGVKEQLLSTLTLLLTRWMTNALPGALVMLSGLIGVACAAASNAAKAAAGGLRDLPPMPRWYLDRSWTGRLMLLLVPALLAWLDGSAWLTMFAGLCTAVFQLAMGVQGVCVLLHAREKHEAGALVTIAAAVMIVMLPAILVWAGVIDQMVDFRGLRPVDEYDDDQDDNDQDDNDQDDDF